MTNYYNIKTGEPAEFISIDSNDIVKFKIAGMAMLGGDWIVRADYRTLLMLFVAYCF